MRKQLAAARRNKDDDVPSVPSRIEDEIRHNVFLRAADDDAFTALRRKKDTFTTVGKAITFFLDAKDWWAG